MRLKQCCHGFRISRLDVCHSAVNCSQKLLYLDGIFFDVALLCHKRGVGHFAAVRAHACHDIALAFAFHLGGRGLKQRHIVTAAPGKYAGHHVKLHAEIKRNVLSVKQALAVEHIFHSHCRHAALTSDYQRLSVHGRIIKIRLGDARHQERAVALCELSEYLGVILAAFVVYVNRYFKKAYIKRRC